MSDENGLNRGGAGNKDSARATFSIESKDKSFRPVLLERRGVSPSPQQGRHNYQVLVVENDEKVQANLSRQLARQGFSVMGASSGRQALAMQSASDLIILDLDLPDLDGLEVCRSVRLASTVPIIVVTSRKSELDCVLALQAGADDYVGKPYGLQELVARIDAVMRRVRSTGRASGGVIELGPLRIDCNTREVVVQGRRISTTRKEFELLFMLAEQPGKVVPREAILHHVWGDSWSRRTVDTHVSSLRGKLGNGSWIVAVRGVGFKLVRQ